MGINSLEGVSDEERENNKNENDKTKRDISPKEKGEITEQIVITELMKRGINILTSKREHSRYDFVIEENGEFYRMQCKTASDKKTVINFPIASYQSNNSRSKRETYEGEIDFFIVYSYKYDQVYVVPIGICSTNGRYKSLRLEPPKNNQKDGVHMAEEYEIDNIFGDEEV